MTPPHPDILTVRDAEILRLLNRVVGIGEYRRQFTADDVARVATERLAPRKAEVRHLRPAPAPTPEPDGDGIPIELTPGQAAVVHELCKDGASNGALAEALGISEETAKTHLRRAYAAMGVRDRGQVIALVLTKQVRIVERPKSNRKKAS